MADKRYYWLKLHKDFFKRHEIRIVEAMPNGKDYILFYLKLLVESVSHEGMLRFSETIPYSVEMMATLTNTNVDVARSAIEVFRQLEMIEVFENQTIFMAEVEKMIGSCAGDEQKKENHRLRQQRYRERKKLECDGHGDALVTHGDVTVDGHGDVEIRDKSIEIRDKNIYKSAVTHSHIPTSVIDQIVFEWNKLGLSQITRITSDTTRGKLLRARINEFGYEKVLQAIMNINNSKFLKGQNNRGWMITFDWLVKPNNFVKVLEGQYSDKQADAETPEGNPFEDW